MAAGDAFQHQADIFARIGLEGRSPLDLFPEVSVERLRGKAWLKGLVEE